MRLRRPAEQSISTRQPDLDERVQRQFFSYFDRKFPFIIRFVVSEYPVAGMGVIDIFALDDFTLPGDPVTMLDPE